MNCWSRYGEKFGYKLFITLLVYYAYFAWVSVKIAKKLKNQFLAIKIINY